MIRVFADMMADLFHFGHVEFLRQARSLGDYLLVGVCSDEVVEAHKRKPILTMEERMKSVAGCRWVDEVIPNAPWTFDPSWIKKYNIDLSVLTKAADTTWFVFLEDQKAVGSMPIRLKQAPTRDSICS